MQQHGRYPVSDDLQFLELSVPAADIRASLEWYRGLGMAEFPTNDARQDQYAVVGVDGFAIGLRGGEAISPGLTFVQPNMARRVLDRVAAGEEFLHAELGIDAFHEAVQSDPNGTWATLLEARTFSPGHPAETPLALTHFESLRLPCNQVGPTAEFWQKYGFIAVETETAACAQLHCPGLQVDLCPGIHDISVRFVPHNYDALIAHLNPRYELTMIRDENLTGVELVAPEGTRIQLMRIA